MLTWLAATAAAASFTVQAQAGGLHRPSTKSSAASDFALPTIPQFQSQPLVQDGMIAEEEVAPNAHVGLGLAPMLGRNVHSVRIEQEPVPTSNPGVTFVIKFPG